MLFGFCRFCTRAAQGPCPKKRRGVSCSHHYATSLVGIGLATYRMTKGSPFGTNARGSRERGAVKEGRKRIIRIVVAALGLTALLALQHESDRLVESAWARSGGRTARAPIVRGLILSDQAPRYLALQYRSYPTEFMGCMIGEARGSAVLVRGTAPAARR